MAVLESKPGRVNQSVLVVCELTFRIFVINIRSVRTKTTNSAH